MMKRTLPLLLAALLALLGCKVTESDGVAKLSAQDRATVTKFGFPDWHKLEKAHYGRGFEHAVVVAAAVASGKSVEQVLAIQKKAEAFEPADGVTDATIALGVVLSETSESEAKKMLKRVSPEPTLGQYDIHPKTGACIVAGAMISRKPLGGALEIFKKLDNDHSIIGRLGGHLTLACMLSGKKPAQVVALYEALVDQTGHHGVSGALTIGVAASGVSAKEAAGHWGIIEKQSLCGPVDAAMLVSGGLLAQARRAKAE